MTKDEALKMAHKTFMQLNERTPRKEDGSGYFDKEINACKEALADNSFCKHGLPKGLCRLGEKDCE
jgi:hypothetical protein